MLNPSRLVACVFVGLVAGSFGCACPPTGDPGVSIDVEVRVFILDHAYLDEAGLDMDIFPFDLDAGGFAPIGDVSADLLKRASAANRRFTSVSLPRGTVPDGGAMRLWLAYQLGTPLLCGKPEPCLPGVFDVYARATPDRRFVDLAIQIGGQSIESYAERSDAATKRAACALSRIPPGVHAEPPRGRGRFAAGGCALFVPPVRFVSQFDDEESPFSPDDTRTVIVIVRATIVEGPTAAAPPDPR